MWSTKHIIKINIKIVHTHTRAHIRAIPFKFIEYNNSSNEVKHFLIYVIYLVYCRNGD